MDPSGTSIMTHAVATVVYVVEPIDSIPWLQLFAPGAANTSDRSVAVSSDFNSCRHASFNLDEEGNKVDAESSSCLRSCCCGII